MRLAFFVLSFGLATAANAEAVRLANSVRPTDTGAAMVVYRDGGKRLSLGLSSQFWAVPYLGSNAQVANGDASDSIGFVARKARVALAARLGGDLELYFELNPLSDQLLSDARLRWMPRRNLALGFGVAEVPYSKSTSRSSRKLRFMDRPLATGDLAIGKRLGLTVEHHHGSKLRGLFGVYNGSDDLTTNRGGLAFGARLESAPLGKVARLVPKALRLQFGAGGVYDRGATVTTTALSVDLLVEMHCIRLFLEATMDKRDPLAQPTLAATLPGSVERRVLIAELTGFVWRDRLELASRFEQYDNNRSSEDFGDQRIITVGANLYFRGHDLKMQLNLIKRDELAGATLDDDAILLGVAAAL
jgi:hypothetical protein